MKRPLHLDPNEQDRINERQAAILLGLPVEELRWLSRAFGLGCREKSEGEEVVFSYEQLRRICLLAASSDD
jgi:hypothetical protein